MRKLTLIMLMVMVGIVTVPSCGFGQSQPKLEAWNLYQGQIPGYRVEIDEDLRGGVWTRLVHLEPIECCKEPQPKPYAITGHDYEGDRLFNRVFIREFVVNGYNAVAFTSKGKWSWEPCPADKDRVRPFTDRQIAQAKAKLNLAMATVYNEGHLIKTLKDF